MIEELLQLFIGEIDAQLLESVKLEKLTFQQGCQEFEIGEEEIHTHS